MDNKNIKKKIYKKISDDLNNLLLTSLEQEIYVDNIYNKLNMLGVEVLLELNDLQFVTSINNNELIINTKNFGEINFNDFETINYKTNLLSKFKQTVKDVDNFKKIENMIYKTPINKVRDIDESILENSFKKNIIINDILITRLKCDLLTDRKICATQSIQNLFNSLEEELNNAETYDYITKMNNQPEMYEQLLNHIKLKYITSEFIANFIYDHSDYNMNKTIYDNHNINIQSIVSKLGIHKLIILSNNLKYIPENINIDEFFKDITSFIENLLFENNINILQKLILYKPPEQENPMEQFLNSNGKMDNKMKLMLAYTKYSQEIQNKTRQIQSKNPKESKEKPKVVRKFSPLEKLGISSLGHYFPNLININYKDNLKSNVIKGSLTGNNDTHNIKKWKNF